MTSCQLGLLLSLWACAGQDKGGDTGSGLGGDSAAGDDSDVAPVVSGCDSADRVGGDSADPDTGDAAEACDGDLPGVRDVKLCGYRTHQTTGVDVSAGSTLGDDRATLVIGSSGWEEDGEGTVEVDLWAGDRKDAWLTEGAHISDTSADENRGFGLAVTGTPDLDGDGHPDLGISALTARLSASDGPGLVFIHYGPVSSSHSVFDADAVITNLSSSDGGSYFGGQSMSSVADINEDGADELLTGGYAEYGDGDLNYHNVPSLFLGPISSMDRADAAATYLADAGDSSSPGVDTASADLDGDGIAEVILSHTQNNTWDTDFWGRVYVIPADLRGAVLVDDVPRVVGTGEDAAIYGERIAAGDATGDGYADLLADMVCDRDDLCGTWLWPGPITASIGTDEASGRFQYERDALYTQVTIAGDLDGDCIPGDLVLGLSGLSEIHLYPAPVASGTYTPDDASRITAADNHTDDLGYALQPLSDQDGDGVDDLLIGAPSDEEGGHNAGAAYLLYGASW